MHVLKTCTLVCIACCIITPQNCITATVSANTLSSPIGTRVWLQVHHQNILSYNIFIFILENGKRFDSSRGRLGLVHSTSGTALTRGTERSAGPTSSPELVRAGQRGRSASLLQNPGTNSRAAQPTQKTAPPASRLEQEKKKGGGKEPS